MAYPHIPSSGTVYPHPLGPVRRTNLIKNPSVETNLTDHSANGAATISRDNAVWPAGGYSIKVINPGTNSWDGVLVGYGGGTGGAKAEEGELFSCSALVYFATAPANVRVDIGPMFFNAAGGYVWSWQTSHDTWVDGRAKRVKHNGGAAPAGAAYACVYLAVYNATNGAPLASTFYVDEVLLEKESTVGAYFDGSTVGSWWDGTAHASTSGAATAPPLRNLMEDPKVVNSGTYSWSSYGGAGTSTTLTYPATGGFDGARYANLDVYDKNYIDTTAGGNWDHYGTIHDTHDLEEPTEAAITVGAWMKAPAGRIIGISAYRVFEGDLFPWSGGYPSDSALASRYVNDNFVTATGSWQWVSTELEAYTGAQHATKIHTRTGFLATTNVVNGDDVCVDHMLVAQGAGLAYFDGDEAEAVWEGTANASPSRRLRFIVRSSEDVLPPTIPGGETRSGEAISHLLEAKLAVLTAPITDDFNRADGNLEDGANWAPYQPAPSTNATDIVNNAIEGQGTNYGYAGWEGTSLGVPAVCGGTITYNSTEFDWYLGFVYPSDLATAGEFAGIEVGWLRRTMWYGSVMYFQAYAMRRTGGTPDPDYADLGYTEIALDGTLSSGDRIACTWDGALVRGWMQRGSDEWEVAGSFEVPGWAQRDLAQFDLKPEIWLPTRGASPTPRFDDFFYSVY